MQSEISFLIDLVLDEELSPKVQKLLRKRIKDLGQPGKSHVRTITQNEAAEQPKALPAPMIAPRNLSPVVVTNNDGTKGPRKW